MIFSVIIQFESTDWFYVCVIVFFAPICNFPLKNTFEMHLINTCSWLFIQLIFNKHHRRYYWTAWVLLIIPLARIALLSIFKINENQHQINATQYICLLSSPQPERREKNTYKTIHFWQLSLLMTAELDAKHFPLNHTDGVRNRWMDLLNFDFEWNWK